MKKHKLFLHASILAVVALIIPLKIEAAPYFQNKVIRIIVGFAVGGGNDRMARIMAKHLPKYIPGKPTIIIENMTGATGMIAANYVYNIAKPDGLTIGAFDRGIPFAQLLNVDGAKFDIKKYSWIGSTAIEPTVLTLRTDLPYKNFDDLKKAKSTIYLAGIGSGGTDVQFPLLLKEYLGLNNIKIVSYPSSADGMLAITRKEVEGKAGAYTTLKQYIESGLVAPLIRGRVSVPEIANLPVDEDLTSDKKGKIIMGMRSSVDNIGRPYMAPPGTPVDVMNILRGAFVKVVKDSELMEDAKKNRMVVQYVSAEGVSKILNYLFSQPEDIIREFKKYVNF